MRSVVVHDSSEHVEQWIGQLAADVGRDAVRGDPSRPFERCYLWFQASRGALCGALTVAVDKPGGYELAHNSAIPAGDENQIRNWAWPIIGRLPILPTEH